MTKDEAIIEIEKLSYKNHDVVPNKISASDVNKIVDQIDMVNNPSHYKGDNGLEVVYVIKSFIGNLKGMQAAYFFNIVKYILRFPRKNGLEDVKKARVYLDWLIELLEE